MNVKKTPIQSLFRNAFREAIGVVLIWVGFCVWVVGSSAVLAYNVEPDDELKLVVGFPAWVFWSVAAPWLVANVVTVWFALRVMKDDDLGPAPEESEGRQP